MVACVPDPSAWGWRRRLGLNNRNPTEPMMSARARHHAEEAAHAIRPTLSTGINNSNFILLIGFN